MSENKNEMYVTFSETYNFEGEEYQGIDLSPVEKISTKDILDADSEFNKSGNMAMMNEMNTGYCLIIASKATGKPIEFFHYMPGNEGLKVKNKVMGFLNK